MAEKTDKPKSAKSAKTGSKIFDVSKPGKQSANSTSRPVIVTNRPIMQDPMMVNLSASVEEAIKKSPSAVKVTIQPLSATESGAGQVKPADDVTNTLDTEPDQPALPKEETPKEESPKEETAQTGSAEKAETEKEESDTKPAAKKNIVPLTEAEKSADERPDDKPAPKTAEKPKESEKAEEPASSVTDSLPTDANIPSDQNVDAKLAAAAEAEAKKQAALDELVESKEYFLPINAVGRRRSKVTAILGIVLILVLLLLLVNLLMDVGVLRINGVKPLTHIFSA